jgi:hypothetical protein
MSEQTEQPQTTVLFRPTGGNELALIRQLNFRAFPPRLYWQPIFYPVLFEEYAVRSHEIGMLKTVSVAM